VSRHALATLSIAALAAAACRPSDAGSTRPVGPPRALGESDRALVAGANAFGWRLLERLAAEKKSPNPFVSPASVAVAVAMTVDGASRPVAEEIRRALGASALPEGAVPEAFGNLVRALLTSDPAVALRIANSVWYRTEIVPNENFLGATAKNFGAKIASLDFASPAAAKAINRWVAEATAGTISSIVPDAIPTDVALYLVDAVYFKGRWTTPFDPKLTRPDSFAAIGGAKVPCRLMQRSDDMSYAETDDAQIVELPYGKGAFRATIVLPRPGSEPDALLADLGNGGWTRLRSGLRKREGKLELPKFTSRFEASLEEPLKALGMPRAFTDSDAFPGIASSLQIGEVRHATFVDLDEEGTEAAAATSVGMEARGYRPPDAPFVMRVDRPFLVAIHEASTGAILFAGRIGDVSQSGGHE
jgi:serine protease inhibitor